MIEIQIEEKIQDKENSMVEHDVLKLQVKRLRDILKIKTNEKISLESRKEQLRASMQERKLEIENKK